MLTDASRKLESLFELLRVKGCLDLIATIRQERAADAEDRSQVQVAITGGDSHLLTENSGELLRALEHITEQILGVEMEERE